jgi:formylglycine-generating enzyme required for sulfatase activity
MRRKAFVALAVFASAAALVSGAASRSDPSLERQFDAAGDMVFIQGGRFLMGSPEGELERELNGAGSETRHAVIVSPFWICRYEVTVGEFRAFVEDAGYVTSAEESRAAYVWTNSGWQTKEDAYWDLPYIPQMEDCPVTTVSWLDCVRYCNWLSEREGLAPAYSFEDGVVACDFDAEGYRLPTEAEWEFACRGGTKGASSFGDYFGSDVANFNGKDPYGDAEAGPNLRKTAAVGSYAPNAYDLYDMHGNVWEWCWDYYDTSYYSRSPQRDPTGPEYGEARSFRGGSWNDGGANLRSANRAGIREASAFNTLGFRLARGGRK